MTDTHIYYLSVREIFKMAQLTGAPATQSNRASVVLLTDLGEAQTHTNTP